MISFSLNCLLNAWNIIFLSPCYCFCSYHYIPCPLGFVWSPTFFVKNGIFHQYFIHYDVWYWIFSIGWPYNPSRPRGRILVLTYLQWSEFYGKCCAYYEYKFASTFLVFPKGRSMSLLQINFLGTEVGLIMVGCPNNYKSFLGSLLDLRTLFQYELLPIDPTKKSN